MKRLASCGYSQPSGLFVGGVQFHNPETLTLMGSVAAPADPVSAGNTYRPVRLSLSADQATLYVFASSASSGGSPNTAVIPLDIATLTWRAASTFGLSTGTNVVFMVTAVLSPSGTVWLLRRGPTAGGGSDVWYIQEFTIPSGGGAATAGVIVASGDANVSGAIYPIVPVANSYGTIIFSPDGTKAYFRAHGPTPDAGTSTVGDFVGEIDVATKTVTRYLVARYLPTGILLNATSFDVSADGTRLYVADRTGVSGHQGFVTAIDLTTGSTVANYAMDGGTADPGGNSLPSLSVRPNTPVASMQGFVSAVSNVGGAFGSGVTMNLNAGYSKTSASVGSSGGKALFYDGIATGGTQVGGLICAGNLYFVVGGGAVSGGGPYPALDMCLIPGAATAPASSLGPMAFALDATDRPAFATALATGTSLYATANAGHTYGANGVRSDAARDVSLIWETQANNPRVLYSGSVSGGVATLSVTTAAKDGEQSDFGTPVSVTGVSGAYFAAAQHPDDRSRVALAYLDGGTLKVAMSYDGGGASSWSYLSSVGPTGLDFGMTGRPAVCWLGESLCVAWASGNNLLCKVSPDGGHTWPGASVTVASAGPYNGLSAVAELGTAYLMANTATATFVFRSGNLGAAWAATPAAPAYQANGASLGFIPATGRLLAGTGQASDDDGATWMTP